MLIVLSWMTVAGCTDPGPQPQFGDPYEILVNQIPGGPDAPPTIAGDWLLLTVTYDGGCTDHEFALESYVRRDTAHIWLRHTNAGDTCEARIVDDLNVALPTGVLDRRVIALYDPAGTEPHFLKW